jgi:hypothetical protein
MDIFYDGTKVTSTQASKPFPFSTNPVNGHDLVPKVKEWLWLSVGASFGDGDFQSQPTGLLSDALVEYVRVFKPSAALNANSISGNNEGVKVYPNPTKDVLHIKSDQQKYQISIFDVNGKQILKKSSNDFITSINTKTYTSGIYFLKIEQNNQIILKKIIL